MRLFFRGFCKYIHTSVIIFYFVLLYIKRRLNSVNASNHSVRNLLSSRLATRNLKIRVYKIIILPVALCGCETWSLHQGRNIK
jgi:hypothetical protein